MAAIRVLISESRRSAAAKADIQMLAISRPGRQSAAPGGLVLHPCPQNDLNASDDCGSVMAYPHRAYEVVAALSSGLDTVVGVAGVPLSAGQVQRILIARALYKRPSLLLLDEATSALDGPNKASITNNIKAVLPGVTSIVAAHRLNTIVGADQVIVLDAGRIVDSGPPRAFLPQHVAQIGRTGPGMSNCYPFACIETGPHLPRQIGGHI